MVSRLAPSPRSRLASKRVNCSGSWAKSRGVSGLIDWDSLVVLLLLVETQTKHLHLHGEHVVGHSLGKTDAGIGLLSGLFQDVEDDATTEADDGRTATIHIHHTVGIRQASCLLLRATGRTPCTYGAAPSRRDYVQESYCLEDVGLLLFGVAVVLAEGCEGGIGHLGEHHS